MDEPQLRELEGHCRQYFAPTDHSAHLRAFEYIQNFSLGADMIPRCQFVINHSNEPYAILYACKNLTKIFSEHWSQFNTAQRKEIRTFILSFLYNKGVEMFRAAHQGQHAQVLHNVNQSVIQLLCRLTKLGWIEESEHDAVNEISKFFDGSIDHIIMGMMLMHELVHEVNYNKGNFSLTEHRKIQISFRNEALLRVLTLALRYLNSILNAQLTGAQPHHTSRLTTESLAVALLCLSFDFIGTNPEESVEDIGTVHLPVAWRPLMEESATVPLFFRIYEKGTTSERVKALQCIAQLVSVRRSIFATEDKRQVFLDLVMQNTLTIMKSEMGLDSPDIFHQLCRVLMRTKANYQLCEIVRSRCYDEWIQAVSRLTYTAFRFWRWSANSLHYLLTLWSRLVMSAPRHSSYPSSPWEQCAPQIVQAYIDTRMQIAAAVVQEDIDDPLENDEQLQQQMIAIPSLVRFRYQQLCEYIIKLLDPRLASYQTLSQKALADHSEQCINKLRLLESELAWLVYIIGAVVGGRQTGSADEDSDMLDGILCGRTFNLIKFTEMKAKQTESTIRLVASLIFFLSKFRRVYIGEMSIYSSKVFLQLTEQCQLKDNLAIIELSLHAMIKTIKTWDSEPTILRAALSLFSDMANGFSSSRLLQHLPAVDALLENHTVNHFPFLQQPTSLHNVFYATLGHLLFTETKSALFDKFIGPIQYVLESLTKLDDGSLRQESIRDPLIGLLRDLRGLISSCTTTSNFERVFDWIFPHCNLFLRIASLWHGEPKVVHALLKFWAEFTWNRTHRLCFDNNSPNGVLLFQETSKFIQLIGKHVLMVPAAPNSPDEYQKRYKTIALCLLVLSRTIGGNYVPFGVCALYNDTAFPLALDMVLKMALSIPRREVMSFPRLSHNFYIFFETLFRTQVSSALMLDSTTFVELLERVHEAITSYNTTIASHGCSIIDSLMSYVFRHQAKEIPSMQSFRLIVGQHPTLFPSLMQVMFSLMVTEDNLKYALSRPLLPLILCNQDAFNELKTQLISTAQPDKRTSLAAAITRLMNNVLPNLEPRNRDKFTYNLGIFRAEWKRIMG